MGAEIEGDDTSTLVIDGVSELAASHYSVMPDRIEAGTFLVAARGDSRAHHGRECECRASWHCAREVTRCRCDVTVEGNTITADMTEGSSHRLTSSLRLSRVSDRHASAIYRPECGGRGVGRITETIFENRLMQAHEMSRMGANITVDGHSVIIRGKSSIDGAPVMASDLRASASLVIAGLAAKGETSVDRIYHIDRGYERIEEKLQAVGADIVRKTR